ncbi:MAG: hypothetical protein ACLPHP_02460 [Candidatus Sulfotelmatobacter sp.]
MASKDLFRPSERRVPVWQRAYQEVLNQEVLKEADTIKLFKLVEVAEAAVRTRQAELKTSLDHHSERRALQEAVAYLQVVKRERLKYEQQYFPD